MLSPTKSLLWSLFHLTAASASTLMDNGTTVTLGGIPYYAGGMSVAMLNVAPSYLLESPASHGSDLFPMTIVHTHVQEYGSSDLRNTVEKFTSGDDVFQEAFLSTVYLIYSGNGTFLPNLTTSASEGNFSHAEAFLTNDTESSDLTAASLSNPLPNGPYFVSARTGEIFEAYRLYTDDFLAFTQTSISDHRGGYLPLPAATQNLMALSVAVPSRLYYTKSVEQPLAGLRLGVKDIYHIKGLKTSGGNRAYFYLYPEQNVTAPSVQRLLDLGAVLVGKTGTVQFANGDRPTADWVDVHCPFNPRGDGYQAPSGSSSGSGAAIGAYDWLDIAVGSDTGGSMRGPAGAQGVFGNRPSTGAVSMDQVIPLSPPLDTAGVLARSGSLWADVTRAWYPNFTDSYISYPKSIYYSAGDSNEDSPAKDLVEGFLDQLQDFLGANRSAANITGLWAESPPLNVSANISDTLYSTYAVLTSVDQFSRLGQPFFDDYAAQTGGRRPFINPGPLVRWQWGQNHSSEYDTAVQNKTMFKNWVRLLIAHPCVIRSAKKLTLPFSQWSNTGYGTPNNATCSNGIFIYPQNLGVTNYRNQYFDAPTTPPLGFSDGRASVYAEGAEVVVPIGEIPYNSTVTLQEEYLPVSLSLVVARGCDFMLAGLVRELEEVGILKESKAGARI